MGDVEYYGYAGKILHVDLTSKKIWHEALDLDMARQFIGGSGINYRLLVDLLKPGIDPLSPDNPIVIGNGPLVDTLAPGASKTYATLKYAIPATPDGRYHVSTGISGGRGFAFLLKRAGYDHVVITGRAPEPVILVISHAEVTIRPAGAFWGKDIYETTDELKHAYGKCGVVAIGRAGENLCRYSMALTDKKSTLGRSGLGAVMGSKNLKAIVAVGGNRAITIFDKPRFDKAVRAVRRDYEDKIKPLGSLTTFALKELHTRYMNPGIWSRAEWDERFVEPAAQIRKRNTCAHCYLDCGDDLEIKEGEHAGAHSETGFMLWAPVVGQRLELPDLGATVKLIEKINRSGIDLVTAFGIMDWVTRRYNENVITQRDTGGMVLKRDLAGYMELLELILERKGIGNILADGWFATSEWVGRDARSDYVEGSGIVKGSDCIYPARAAVLDAVRFTMITSPRGGHAGTSGSGTGLPDLTLEQVQMEAETLCISEERMKRIFEPVPYYGDYNLGRFTSHTEDLTAINNCLGTCFLWSSVYLTGFDNLAEMYSAATGMEISPHELKLRGEAVFNLNKLLNVREGFGRTEDAPPPVWFKPIQTPDGEQNLENCYRTKKLNPEDVDHLLDDYYDERGWDIRTGMPTKEKLKELGLDTIASMLQ